MTDREPDPDAERLGELADASAEGGVPAPTPDDAEGEAVARASRALAHAWRLGEEELSSFVDAIDEAQPVPPPPALPDDYTMLGEIGRGGTGVVYRARQRSLERDVAVKVLRTGDLLFGSALRRFEREARALARLRHPHIVAVHEVGSADGRLWFSMDLVEGRSLADRLREGPLAPPLAARLVADVAGAVAYVHTHGLVHRDVKPGNILLDRDGNPFVTDFGLALEIGSDAGLTLTGQIVGTPAYMSPEQARGDLAAIGAATDVYALGAVLYECLTGRRPFQGLSPAEQVYAVIHREPPAPRHVDGRIPEPLERVCLKAMRKRPSERYATAAALEADLGRFLAGQPVSAEGVSAPRRMGRWARKHATAIGWSVAACLAVALALALAPWRTERAAIRVGSDHLRHVAKRALERGDGVEAEDSLRKANALERRKFPGDLDDARRLSEARIATARGLMDSGKADEALGLLDATMRECREWTSPPDREGQSHRFALDLSWARAAALHRSGRRDEAMTAYRATLKEVMASYFVTGEMEQEFLARQLRTLAPTLRNPDAPGHDAALGEMTLLIQERILQDIGLFVSFAHEDARHLAWLLQACFDPPPDPSVTETRMHTNLIRHTLGSRPPAGVEAVLARVGRDGARHLRTRRAAAILLGDLADVPTPAAFASLHQDKILDGPWDPDETFSLWERWAKTEPRLVHTERMDRAIVTWKASLEVKPVVPAGAVPVTSAWAVARYLRDRTGMPVYRTVEEAEDWLHEHSGEEPWRPLAVSLGLAAASGPPAAEDILRHWPRFDESKRLQAHFLLTWLVPTSEARPRMGPSSVGESALLSAWRELVAESDGTRRVRTARIAFDPSAGWALDPSGERTVELGTSRPAESLRWSWLDPAHETHGDSLLPPGFGPPRVQRPQRWIQTTVGLNWGPKGLQYGTGALERRGPGSMSSSSSSSGYPADAVLAIDFTELGYSTPDDGRNGIHLLAAERRDMPPARWRLEDWRLRIATDVTSLADSADSQAPAATDRPWESNLVIENSQLWLLNVGLIGMRLPIPEAVEGLRRLDVAMAASNMASGSAWESQRALIFRARLLAGDAQLLADPATLDRLRKERKGFPDVVDRREAQMWVRVLCEGTPGPRRDLAILRLGELDIPADSAGDLLDAERAGRTTIPPDVRAKVLAKEHEDRSIAGHASEHPVQSTIAALIALAGGLAFVLLASPGRPRWRRLVPAAWLVMLGVFAECYDLILAGVDVLPDVVGLAAATLGSLVLATSVGGRLRWAPVALFAVGAAATAIEMAGITTLSGLRLVTVWGAVAVLPPLAARLRGPRAEGAAYRPWPWPFALLYVVPLAIVAVVALTVLVVPAWTARVNLDRNTADILVGVLGVCALWALVITIRAAAVRAAWMRSRARA